MLEPEILASDRVGNESNSDGMEALTLTYPHINFTELKKFASIALCAPCIRVERLTQESGYKLFLLFFKSIDISTSLGYNLTEPEWSCIAKFVRGLRRVEHLESELSTMNYVKSGTDIPVPDVYSYDLGKRNKVGAPFILMERMPGSHLHTIWDALSIEHKKVTLTHISGVLAQLSSVKFDMIGCLKGGRLEAMINMISGSKGPFESTYDYCFSFLPGFYPTMTPSDIALIEEMKHELKAYLEDKKDKPYLHTPYRLIHPDFSGKNMLFFYDKGGVEPPQLSGIINWEHAYTGPLYYLYKYPTFIQDPTFEEDHGENAILRSHFYSALQEQFPKGSPSALAAKLCLETKFPILDQYQVRISWKGARG